jgi:hypothetical protein
VLLLTPLDPVHAASCHRNEKRLRHLEALLWASGLGSHKHTSDSKYLLATLPRSLGRMTVVDS